MEKFKVIEKSRFLTNKEMNQLDGGCECWQTKYTICDRVGYILEPCFAYTLCPGGYSSCSGIGGRTTCTELYEVSPVITPPEEPIDAIEKED